MTIAELYLGIKTEPGIIYLLSTMWHSLLKIDCVCYPKSILLLIHISQSIGQ